MFDSSDNLTLKAEEALKCNRLVSLTPRGTVVYPGHADAILLIGEVIQNLEDYECIPASVKKAHTVRIEVAAPVTPGIEVEYTPDGRIQPLAAGTSIGYVIEAQDTVGCLACICLVMGGSNAGAEGGGGGTGNTSVLTANADGSFSHDDGTGNVVVIPAPPAASTHTPSSFTDNGDGTYTHDDGTGNTVTTAAPPAAPGPSVFTDNGDGTYTHDDGGGTTVTIPNSIDNCVQVANADGSAQLTFTSRDGTNKIVDIPAPEAGRTFQNCNFNAATGELTLNFLDADGVTVSSEPCDLSALQVDVNIDAAALDATGLILNITDTSGETFIINLSGLLSTFTANADGTITATNGDGSSTVTIPNSIDDCSSATDAVTGDITLTFTKRDGSTVDKVIPGAAAHTPSSFTDNGDGTYTHDDGQGNAVTTAAPAVHSPSSYTDNQPGAGGNDDGSIVLDDGNGGSVTIPNSIDGCASATDPTTGDITHTFTSRDGTTKDIVVAAATKPDEVCSQPTQAHGVLATEAEIVVTGDCVRFADCGDFPTPGIDPATGNPDPAFQPTVSIAGFDANGKLTKNPIGPTYTQIVNLPGTQGTPGGVLDVAGADALTYNADTNHYYVFVDVSAGIVDLTALSLVLPNLNDQDHITFYATSATSPTNRIEFNIAGLVPWVQRDYSILTLRLCIDPADPTIRYWLPV